MHRNDLNIKNNVHISNTKSYINNWNKLALHFRISHTKSILINVLYVYCKNGKKVLQFVYMRNDFPSFPTCIFSPSRRREAPCEGTNSPRLFTPGETKALAESKAQNKE
jgi:hypothetical protein